MRPLAEPELRRAEDHVLLPLCLYGENRPDLENAQAPRSALRREPRARRLLDNCSKVSKFVEVDFSRSCIESHWRQRGSREWRHGLALRVGKKARRGINDYGSSLTTSAHATGSSDDSDADIVMAYSLVRRWSNAASTWVRERPFFGGMSAKIVSPRSSQEPS